VNWLLIRIAAAMLVFGLSAGVALAVEFPSRPVRIITPFPAGSGPEAVLRLLADKLSKRWKQPVIVENRPGGNGFIAIDAFKHGATDGHDLLQLDSVHLSAYPHLFRKLPYDAAADFEPILPLFRTYFFFAVGTDSKYPNLAALIDDARRQPGKLNYGSWSVGNPVHLGSALFESETRTQMVHVLYKETTQLYTDVATGELSFALGSIATSGALQRAGKLRYLALAAPQRSALFPNVPTVTEAGGPAGFEVTGWTTLVAPHGAPAAVVEQIQRDVEAALNEPDSKERYRALGYEPFPLARSAFVQYIQRESLHFAGVIRKAGVSLQ